MVQFLELWAGFYHTRFTDLPLHDLYASVRNWPFSDSQEALFSVCFGENRRSNSINQRRITTLLVPFVGQAKITQN